MVIYYFWLSQYDAIEFQRMNVALDSVPEYMWLIAGSIISFYFVAREFSKGRDTKMALSRVQFDETIRRQRELDDMKPRKPLFSQKDYNKVMASPKPLSNSAIAEWNRRRHPQQDL